MSTKNLDLEKIRLCSHLLPDPGGKVVRELCDEIACLHAEIAALKALHEAKWIPDETAKEIATLRDKLKIAITASERCSECGRRLHRESELT